MDVDEMNSVAQELLANLRERYAETKEEFYEKFDPLFSDVRINCGSIILPAHKFVISSRSEILAQQLSSGINELDWSGYERSVCIAILRWIYTDKVVLDDDNLMLGLLRASFHLRLASLFETCERTLLTTVNEKTSFEFHNIAKEVGSKKLVEKCFELNSNCNFWPEKLQTKNDEATNEDLQVSSVLSEPLKDLDKEVGTLAKLSRGVCEFLTFSDAPILTCSCCIWPAHEHFLSSRSNSIREHILHTKSEEGNNNRILFDGLFGNSKVAFIRWLYTDILVLNNDDDMCDTLTSLLTAAHVYKLPKLFERCEKAIVEQLDITTCAKYHNHAMGTGAKTVMKHCKQLIQSYWNGLRSPNFFKIDMESEADSGNSLCVETAVDTPSDGVCGLLSLNDDCLLHLFRFVSLIDLGSIKATCKRLTQLADQSFKLRKDKSLSINSYSMFADIWNLKHFGKLIHSLDLKCFYLQYVSYEEIFEMIGQCSNNQLKSISLNLDGHHTNSLTDVSFTQESFKCLKKALQNIECIKLKSIDEEKHIDWLLAHCESLKEIQINVCEMDLPLWCTNIANIKRLILQDLQNDNFLKEACDKLINLECLVLDVTENTSDNNNIYHVSRLATLKELKISNYHNIGPVLQRFANNNALEYLCLSYTTMSETLGHAFSNFPNLKELVFENVDGFGETELHILSNKLVGVEKLAFIDCEEITFEAVTTIVEHNLNLKELSVNGCDNIVCIDKDSYLRLRKKRDLEILLDSGDYERSIKLIGNILSNYVRVTVKPEVFFTKLYAKLIFN